MNAERIIILKKFIEEEPTNPFNKYALAMEYYETNPSESLIILSDLLDNHRNYLPTYFKAGHLYWDMEQMEEASRVFKLGIELANHQRDAKAEKELRAAYQNFQFEWND